MCPDFLHWLDVMLLDLSLYIVTTKKTRSDTSRSIRITESNGNGFADLDFVNPELELLKARRTLQIYKTLKERKLTQVHA